MTEFQKADAVVEFCKSKAAFYREAHKREWALRDEHVCHVYRAVGASKQATWWGAAAVIASAQFPMKPVADLISSMLRDAERGVEDAARLGTGAQVDASIILDNCREIDRMYRSL